MHRDSTEAFAVSEYIRSVDVGRTRRGILFIVLGILISAVPILSPIGEVIALTGVVWFALGRNPFGERHSNYATIATAVFVLGIAFGLVGSIAYLLFALSLPGHGGTFFDLWQGNPLFTSALDSSLQSILATEATGAILTGIAYALSTYCLQRNVGRTMPVVGLTTSLITSVVVFSLLSSDVSPELLSAFSRGSYEPDFAYAFENQVLIVSLLNLIPTVIYGAAYRLAYSRLSNGELP